jgi:hypothetical protein
MTVASLEMSRRVGGHRKADVVEIQGYRSQRPPNQINNPESVVIGAGFSWSENRVVTVAALDEKAIGIFVQTTIFCRTSGIL